MALTTEDIKQINSLFEPIRNQLAIIKVDLSDIKNHISLINERLYKLEVRTFNLEIQIDKKIELNRLKF